MFSAASAQLVEVVFGPLEGDSAGILYADTDQAIVVDLWIRTAPGISIVYFGALLSSSNEYIASNTRQGGWYSQFLDTWDDVHFFTANPDPVYGGYTNQSLIGVCALAGWCEYDEGIHTEGEWWWIASYRMTTVSSPPLGIPLCDALIEGHDEWSDGVSFADFDIGEIDRSDIELHFACLEFHGPSCGYYVVGDFNGSGAFNIADIVESFSNLKTGLPDPALLCECPPNSGNQWAVAMDVNNSCGFNVADIVSGFSYLKTGSPEPSPCGICPPGEP
jgi:hypothetical protein